MTNSYFCIFAICTGSLQFTGANAAKGQAAWGNKRAGAFVKAPALEELVMLIINLWAHS